MPLLTRTLFPRNGDVKEEYPINEWLDVKDIPCTQRSGINLMLSNGQEFHAKDFLVYAPRVSWKPAYDRWYGDPKGEGELNFECVFPLFSFCVVVFQNQTPIQIGVYGSSEQQAFQCSIFDPHHPILTTVNDLKDRKEWGRLEPGEAPSGNPFDPDYGRKVVVVDNYHDNEGSYDLSIKVIDWGH